MNQFELPKGYMPVALLDVLVITGCLIIGEPLPLFLDENLRLKKKAHMEHHKNKMPSYAALIPTDLSKIREGTKISFEETVDFF